MPASGRTRDGEIGEGVPALFWVLGLVAIYLVLELPYLTRAYPITVDESWYSQVAHSVATGGGFRNPVIGSGGGDMFFLYTSFLALVYKAFGTQLILGRLLSLSFGAVAVAGVAALLRRSGLAWRDVALCTLTVAVSSLSYLAFRVVRPEAAATAFLVWSVYFLLASIHEDAGGRSRERAAALCGLLAGGGFLCHPNAALVMAGIGLAQLAAAVRYRRVTPLLIYLACSGASVVLLIAFMSFVMDAGLVNSLGAMTNRTAGGDRAGPNLAGDVLGEIQRFFSRLAVGGRRGVIVAIQVGVLAWGVSRLRRFDRGYVLPLLVVFYLAIAFVALRPFPIRGFVLVEWMVWATAGLLVSDLARSGGGWKLNAARAAIALALINNLAGNLYVIQRDRGTTPYADIASEISRQVPTDATVLSHMLLWFPMADARVFTSYSRWRQLPGDSVDALLDAGDVDYLVLMDEAGIDTRTSGATGRDHKGERPIHRYTRKLEELGESTGEIVSAIPTRGYGQIRIWRLPSADAEPQLGSR